MTATLTQDFVASPPVPAVDDANGAAPSPAPLALPDTSRVYFPEAHVTVEPPFRALYGPLTPTPAESLADVVWRVAA